MIPLKDDNPTRGVPWVTALLIVLNVAVFIMEWRMAPGELQAFISSWAFTPADFLAAPTAPHRIATVFSAMFMHAGPIHVGGNMLYLWIFGNNIEDRIGALPFLAFYLTTGVAATAAQTLSAPASTVPLVGASGAVAGVLAAYILLYPRADVLTVIPIFFFIEIARIPAYLVIGFWFLLQLANGLVTFGAETVQSGGTAWFAHIGGFAAGLLLIAPVALFGKKDEKRSDR